MKKNKVAVKLVEREGAGHDPLPDMDEVDHWFKTYLQ